MEYLENIAIVAKENIAIIVTNVGIHFKSLINDNEG